MDQVTLNIITSPREILKALVESKVTNSVIAIKSKVLGPGTYMTSVVELVIDDKNETRIMLKGYDTSGYFFDRSSLKLEEIESVIPFDLIFENPFLRDHKRETGTDKSLSLKVS